MAEIIEFNEFSTTLNGSSDELHCWLCQKTVSSRALFCHHCGTIQPVRALDHFARLGIERRIDIDIELLDRQYQALRRTLDPGRFTIRGVGERGHAAKQMEALDEAFDTLRDALRRGRYWLFLHQQEFDEAKSVHPVVADLRHELEVAAAPAHCDRVAQKAGHAMEQGILGLMQALRTKDWQQANATLVKLDGLESILNNVRTRRASLMPKDKGTDGLSSVK